MIMCVFAKFCAGTLYDAAVCRNILQITQPRFTPRAPLFEKSLLLNGRF
jgi:hypothetical protein